MGPLLSGDSVNSGRCYATPASYTYAVASLKNRGGVASGVLYGTAPRLYVSTYRVHFELAEVK
jgi:hypothetical protein